MKTERVEAPFRRNKAKPMRMKRYERQSRRQSAGDRQMVAADGLWLARVARRSSQTFQKPPPNMMPTNVTQE